MSDFHSFEEDFEDGDYEDCCDYCAGAGKVAARDYESYLGASYVPCPECHGDLCEGEPGIMELARIIIDAHKPNHL